MKRGSNKITITHKGQNDTIMKYKPIKLIWTQCPTCHNYAWIKIPKKDIKKPKQRRKK